MLAWFELDTFPVDLLFWRPSCETYCHHRCPLFDSSIGITLLSISIDQMHCFNLGVVKKYVSWALWFMLDASSERHELAMRGLWLDLRAFYKRHPGSFTEMEILTLDMLPPLGRAGLRVKGAEAKGVLCWAVAALEEHVEFTQAPGVGPVREAGRMLVQHLELLEAPGPVSLGTRQQASF